MGLCGGPSSIDVLPMHNCISQLAGLHAKTARVLLYDYNSMKSSGRALQPEWSITILIRGGGN